MTVTRRLPMTTPIAPRPARRGSRGPRLLALLTATFLAGAALAFWGAAAAGAINAALNALPPVQINPTNLLYTHQSGAAVDPALLLLAPLVCAVAPGLLSLGGPPWRRVILALLGLLVAIFNLLACLAYVWEFAWNEGGAGVIGLGVYLALSASLALAILNFGCWHLALARAWTWPALRGRHARGVLRLWVALAGCGAATLLASDLMVWGQWRASSPTAHAEAVVPVAILAVGAPGAAPYALAALFALPLSTVLCAYLITRAPRWGRPPLASMALLAGSASLALCLLALARLYLRASGSSVIEAGAVVGLGGGALLLTALFGLLSTPLPTVPTPAAAPATIPIAAATTRRVTAPISAPPASPRRRAPTTQRLAEAEPVSALRSAN